MNYHDWEKAQEFSPCSPEAYYTEIAWTAAIEEVRSVIRAAYPTEHTSAGLALMLDTELDGML